MASSSSVIPSFTTFNPRGLRGLSGASDNGTYGFSSTGSKSQYGFKPFKMKSTSSKGPTAAQALEAVYLHNKAHPHRGLFSSILHGATHAVETGLDYLARPSYAVASGVYDATKGGGFNVGQFLHGASQGIQGKQKMGFGQVLSEHGILKGHGILRGIAGLGLDVVTDPLTYAGLGAAPADAELAAKAAEMGVSKDALRSASDAALKGSFKTSAEAGKAADMLKQAGSGFEARTGLARAHQSELKLVEKGLHDTKFGAAKASRLHGMQALAQAEFDTAGPRMVTASYKIPFGPRLTKQLPMHAPSLLRVANSQGIIGKLPGLPKAAETVGKAFKPGWGNEKMHALEIMSKHVAELRQDSAAHILQSHLVQPLAEHGGLPNETNMRHALQWGETTPGIVKMRPGRAERKLNLTMLNKAVTDKTLTDHQAKFLQAWHNTTEALRKADAEYGVKYDSALAGGARDNVVYVPHVRVSSTGEKFTKGASVLAKKSFQFPRNAGSQMELAAKIQSEDPALAKQLMTHPIELLARRAQSGATKQAEQFMTDTVMSTFGHATRLPNTAAQAQLLGRRLALEAKADKLTTLSSTGLAQLHHDLAATTEGERLNSLTQAGTVHAAREVALKRKIASIKGQITKQSKRTLPSAQKFLGMKNEDFNKFVTKLGKHPLAGPLKAARAQHKALDSLDRAAAKSLVDAGNLAPITGATPHGSNYKRLINDLLNKASGTIPASKLKAMRAVHLEQPFKRGESWAARHANLVEDLKAETKLARQQNTQRLQGALDKTLPRRKSLASQLAVQQQTLERHHAAWPAIEAKINERAAGRLKARMSALDERQVKELRYGEALGKAMNRIDKKIEYHSTSVVNPDAYKAGYKVVDRLKAPNGKPVALPAEMADALTRARSALSNDEFLQKFQNTWQKLVAEWKVGVTVVNPGYRVRNTLSDLWNAYISPHGGVPLWAMSKYGTKAAKLIQTVRHLPENPKTWTADQRQAAQLFTEAYHHGILAGLFQGDVEKVRRFLEGSGSSKELLKGGHPLQALTKTATDFNRHAENWGRLMHYLYRREGQHMGAAEAAKIVRAAHFDYEDLTPTEQALKRWAVPFYTWTRKNIPYQISQAATSPGKYAAFPLMANESNYASPKDPGQIVPSWIKQGLGFHVPFGGKGNFYLPVFGPVDLEKLQHPASQGMSMLSPMMQIPIELMTNKSLNTGAPIYGSQLSHPRTPISGFAASILQNLPGTDVGQTSRTVNGKKMVGPGANPLVSYIASQTPLTNLVVNAESNIKKAQRGGGQKAALSEFGGISTYKPDQAAQQAAAQFNAQQGFKQYMRGLRDMGVIPEPKKAKASKYTKRNNALANVAFGGQ